MKEDTLPKTIKCIWHLQSWGVVFPFQKNSEGKKPRGRRCPAKELASITSCLGSSKSKESWACQQLWVGRCSCQELSTSDPVWGARLARGGAAAGAVRANPAGCRATETVIILCTGWEACKGIIDHNIHYTASEGTAGWHRHLKNVWNNIPN